MDAIVLLSVLLSEINLRQYHGTEIWLKQHLQQRSQNGDSLTACRRETGRKEANQEGTQLYFGNARARSRRNKVIARIYPNKVQVCCNCKSPLFPQLPNQHLKLATMASRPRNSLERAQEKAYPHSRFLQSYEGFQSYFQNKRPSRERLSERLTCAEFYRKTNAAKLNLAHLKRKR